MMKNTARSLALLALCSAARGASVPAMSSFFGLGTYAISTSSNTPNDLSLFGHVGNVDNLSGVSVVVDGVNYFSGLSDGERSYLTMRSSPKHGGELSCQSEPGNTYSTVGLEFLPRLKATGRTGTFGPFYNTTPAAEFVSNEGTCWVSIVPFFECIVTAWIPLDPTADGVPAVLGYTVNGTMTGITASAEVAFKSMIVNATGADLPPGFAVPAQCSEGPPPQTCSQMAGSTAGEPSAAVPTAKMVTYKNVPASTGLVDENSADAVGEALWLCWHTKNNKMSNIVTAFATIANTDWGIYAQCNFKECMNPSPESNTVGRQMPGKFLAMYPDSQCSTDPAPGYWYSWPSSTRCVAPRTPDGGSCAWADLGARKSITVDCLASVKFYDACPAIPQPPLAAVSAVSAAAMSQDAPFSYAHAAAILEQAFNSDDPSQGGCPNVL